MKSKLTDVRPMMDSSVFKGEKFTAENKRQVLDRISVKERKLNWVPRSLSVVFSLILIVAIGYMLNGVLADSTPVQQGNPDGVEQPPTPPQEPAETVVPEESGKEDTVEEEEEAADGFFRMTPEELAIYDEFSADFDLSHLKDLEPVSVAKLYVWAGYNQNYEAEYELLTDREESIMWDKEYHLTIPDTDRMPPEKLMEFFRNLEAGEFRQMEDYRGVISFRHGNGPEGLAGMSMLQNDDGVWQVGFMALQ